MYYSYLNISKKVYFIKKNMLNNITYLSEGTNFDKKSDFSLTKIIGFS